MFDNLAVKLGITDSGNVNLVSQTTVGQANQVITLSELKTSTQDSNTTEKKEIKLEDINDCYSESGKLRWKYIKQFNIPKNLNWCRDIIETIYCLKNNILSIPQCPECGNILNFLGINKGYRTYCSTVCSNNSEIVKDNKVRVLMERYGVKNSSHVHLGPKDPLDFNPRRYKTSGYIYIMKSDNLNKFKINPREKGCVFSNGLKIEDAINIHKEVSGLMKDSYGLGTILTCGLKNTSIKPSNIVIKATACRLTPNHPWTDIVLNW
jgi:hypothetical protein